MQTLSFTSNGRTLNATIFLPTQPKEKSPAVLFIHGWTSEQKRSFRYAEELAKLGYISFLFDMSGHGSSDGDINTITSVEFLADCKEAYSQLLRIPNVDKEKIYAVGSSFGGYLVALLSNQVTLTGVVLRVPADYPDGTENQPKSITGGDVPEIAEWRKKIKPFEKSAALRAIHSFNGNVLVIESELDAQVPHETVQSYANAVSDQSKLTHVVMKNAPHSIKEGPFKEEVCSILTRWFRNQLTQ